LAVSQAPHGPGGPGGVRLAQLPYKVGADSAGEADVDDHRVEARRRGPAAGL
jgi:hypothetical protein